MTKTSIPACRILLTGAQGTGKSTLARAIVARLQAAGVAGARAELGLGARVAGSGHATGGRAGADAVRAFVAAHLEREVGPAGGIVVFDRGLIDTLAYADVLGCLPRDEHAALERQTIASSACYRLRLWLRVTQDYPVERPEDESPAFRRAIDAAVGAIAARLGIALRPVAIPPAEVRQVAREVADALARAGSPQR